MRCPACGSDQILDYHGHFVCVCGRMVDGDCCQGAPMRTSGECKSEPLAQRDESDQQSEMK